MRKRTVLAWFTLITVSAFSQVGTNDSSCTTSGSKAYKGLVATRTEVVTSSNNGFTWIMDRTQHIAREDIGSGMLQMLWGNYFINGDTEAGIGGGSYKASIEYPAGVITTCTFNGGASYTSVPALADAMTDPCGPAIPRGANFWVRGLYVNPKGIIFNSYNSNHFGTDTANFGTGDPQDATGGGDVPNGYLPGVISYPPLAIIAPTTRAAGCLLGDSRVAGVADQVNDVSGDVGELARFVGPAYAYAKLSVPGSTLTGTLSNFANRLRILQYCSFAINELGINDNAQANFAGIAMHRNAMAALLGVRTWGTTLPSVTMSTDNWATTANQKTIDDARAFNALERLGIVGEAGNIDVASAIDPRGLGVFPVSPVIGDSVGAAQWGTIDGTHETPALNAKIAQILGYTTTWFLR